MSDSPKNSIEQYCQQLMANSALSDQLEPAAGRKLLDWGCAQLRQTAPDDDLAERYETITRLLRQVNGMSPMLAYLVEDELAEDLALAFVGTVAELTGTTLGDAWMEELVEKRSQWDEATTFNHLLATLTEVAGH